MVLVPARMKRESECEEGINTKKEMKELVMKAVATLIQEYLTNILPSVSEGLDSA